jgi:DNA-binding transcriptional regulator YdaS (Cro superfamily)
MLRTKTTQVRLSALTGIPQSLLSKYVRGIKTPQVPNAVAIEKATGGAVPVESWIPRRVRSRAA